MKKLFVALIILATLALVVVFTFSFFVEKTLIAGVETLGPELTKTTVELENVNLSIFDGRIEIIGLEVGNPDGFKSEYAMRLGRVVLDVVPMSLISNKIVVEEIRVDGPELNYETSLSGANISKILKAVESDATSEDEVATESGKRFEIRRMVISNGKVTLSGAPLGGEDIVVPLVDIEITDIGTNEEGATLANVVKRVLASINTQTISSAASSGKVIGKQLEDSAESLKSGVGGFLKGLKKQESEEK